MPHKGPAGVPRPMISCQQSIAFEINKTLRDKEKQNLQSTLSKKVDYEVTVREGISFQDGGETDVIFRTSSSRIDDETFDELQNILITEGYSTSSWRIGDV